MILLNLPRIILIFPWLSAFCHQGVIFATYIITISWLADRKAQIFLLPDPNYRRPMSSKIIVLLAAE